jgi:hypothetical protein
MTARWPGRFASFVCLPIIAGLIAVPGCRKRDPGFEVMTLEGTIEKIKLTADDAGEITVTYYSEKHGQEMEGTGLVTPETEIMINGAVAKLKDLREGERVRGEVRIEKENDKKRQIALKIYIDRPKPVGSEGG